MNTSDNKSFNDRPKRIANRRFQMTGTDIFFKRVEEVANARGSTIVEALRNGFNRYYETIWRKEAHGYQSGFLAASGRQAADSKRAHIELMTGVVRNGTDAQITEMLRETGFITAEMETDGTAGIRTDEQNGSRWFSIMYGPGSYSDRLSLLELENALRKHLKKSVQI